MSMSTTASDLPQLAEIDVGHKIETVTFTANGEYLVGGGEGGVQVWRVQDGERVATLPTEYPVWRVATSKDGRWIAAGTERGGLSVWDSATYENVLAHTASIFDVDFSPDSARLVASEGSKAIIWDIATRRKLHILDHGDVSEATATKYSPQGDRIATITLDFVRVWNNDGHLLVCVELDKINRTHTGLLWFNNYLLVRTEDGEIKEIDPATGTIISKWTVPYGDHAPCIAAMPQHGRFIAHVAEDSITLWDTSTHVQLCSIRHHHGINSIAFSPDGQLLAIANWDSKISVKNLFRVSEPENLIDSGVFELWKNGQLADVETSLTAAISTSQHTHHALASRAIVRARLGQWDTAIDDATKSIDIQRSVIGHIAYCVALAGNGKVHDGCEACDIGYQYFQSTHVTILLLVKAVVLFLSGEHEDAISRMDDLITTLPFDPTLYVVQAYMYFLDGSLQMEKGNYEDAIRSCENARVKLGICMNQPPLIVLLISGWKFENLAFRIEQRVCEAFFTSGRIAEAGECLLRMVNQEIDFDDEQVNWIPDFRSQYRRESEKLGDNAMNAREYDKAILLYTTALSLNPAIPQDLLVKRSKAYERKGEWKDALNDAEEVIKFNPSSPWGYERKHEVLHGARLYEDALDAFETMLSKMSQSSDPEIRGRSGRHVTPEETKKAIRTIIRNVICDFPLVLIDTTSGRLCDISERAAAFESMPDFAELVSSMTTEIDHTRIEQVVREFYSYVMFSHTWQGNEPLFDLVVRVLVYDLEKYPTHEKLQMFCKIVQEAGFRWAWSDTCCINKADAFVLQEALNSMFTWYENSALTIVYLLGVGRLAERGALVESLWNSRGWALQEYHASKVVRFYTEDWTPYLGLNIYNHKESPEIIAEMEAATGVSAQTLMALRPGLDYIREKLRLASTRQTTRIEDAAYSLLGIFSLSLPVLYGEGDKALGQLLAQLLASSGDTSILAWTGRSGSFNSCLPTSITVYIDPPTSHVPPVIASAEMETITSGLRSIDLTLATRLYDHLNNLPVALFLGRRMKLPCLVFKLGQVSASQSGSVFHAQTTAFGIVEIRTKEDLSRLDSLCLVYPWIDALLDRHPVGSVSETVSEESADDLSPVIGELPLPGPSHITSATRNTQIARFIPRILGPPSLGRRLNLSSQDSASLLLPSTLSLNEGEMHAVQFIARLRQPFGALLLARNRRNVEEYRRVATDSLIKVQLEITTLENMIRSARVLDVL